eukprot:TRINITY_DN2581_c0_g1_i1.p1 TRINITY_DN2581_c0_g1~~TRINITY_DN2581_c0_g1_i1.p1  ORF type:complete len:182 (+),score=14.64 TRINITY_DN2581_c0_g1_i1:203-748(+)
MFGSLVLDANQFELLLSPLLLNGLEIIEGGHITLLVGGPFVAVAETLLGLAPDRVVRNKFHFRHTFLQQTNSIDWRIRCSSIVEGQKASTEPISDSVLVDSSETRRSRCLVVQGSSFKFTKFASSFFDQDSAIDRSISSRMLLERGEATNVTILLTLVLLATNQVTSRPDTVEKVTLIAYK